MSISLEYLPILPNAGFHLTQELVLRCELLLRVIPLSLVLELLRRDQWQVKRSKCSFAQRQLSYLGHTISQHGVATETPKMKNIANWSSPQSVKEVRSFLGLAGYYRRFVRHFGIIAKPLTHLQKKHGEILSFEATKETGCFSVIFKNRRGRQSNPRISLLPVLKARHKPKDGQPLLNQDLHLFE